MLYHTVIRGGGSVGERGYMVGWLTMILVLALGRGATGGE